MAAKPKRGRVGVAVSIRPMDHYEVEEAARTIARAEAHKRNKPLMAKVRQHVAGLTRAVKGG